MVVRRDVVTMVRGAYHEEDENYHQDCAALQAELAPRGIHDGQ